MLPLINELATFSAPENRLLVPLEIQNHLKAALAYLHTSHAAAPRAPPRIPLSLSHDSMIDQRVRETSIKINRQTTLDVLYHYPLNSVLEYPETRRSGSTGHLFRIDPENWSNPILNVAYSRGMPSGRTKEGCEVFVDILVDLATGQKVPCVMRHTTCKRFSFVPSYDIYDIP